MADIRSLINLITETDQMVPQTSIQPVSLIYGDKDVMGYVVSDDAAHKVLAAFPTVGQATKWRSQSGLDGTEVHNLTFHKIPDFIKEFARADKAYCERRAQQYARRAEGLREKAAELIGEAEDNEKRAKDWRP